MKTKVVQIAIYNHTVQVLFGDRGEIKDTLVKKFKASENGIDNSLIMINDAIGAYIYHDNEYYIWLPKTPTTIKDYGVLVHEIQHFVFNFLKHKGLTHSEDSDEAYSYLFEYVYTEIDKWILKLQKEENNN